MLSEISFAQCSKRVLAFIEQEAGGGVTSHRGCNPGTDDVFARIALELFRLQVKHVPGYQAVCTARGITPEDVCTWDEIPPLPVSAFRQLELTSLPAQDRTTVFHSSGTTGSGRSRHFHNATSLTIYEASLWQWFQRHLLTELSPVGTTRTCATPTPPALLILTPSPLWAPHSSLAFMFEALRRRLDPQGPGFVGTADAAGDWGIAFLQATRTLAAAQQTARPLMILTTAFGLVQLLDHLEGKKLRFDLPPGSRLLETGGYKGRSRSIEKRTLYGWVEQALGIPEDHVVSEYGMCELSSQGYDWTIPISPSPAPAIPNHAPGAEQQEPKRRFRLPPWARVQIVSPENGRPVAVGETGLVRVFDLANVRSVLAMQTEDLGVCHEDGFELVGRAAQSEPRGCSLMSATP